MAKAANIDHNSSEAQNTIDLLNPQEYRLCEQLAAGSKPWSQRAQALLAINEGASETVASGRSQLRATQVRFWLNKFNRVGMEMFPEDLLNEASDNSAPSTDTPTGEALPSVDETGKAKKLKKTKKAKSKKEKGKKKKSKVGKGKRSKKKEEAESAGSKPKKKKNKK